MTVRLTSQQLQPGCELRTETLFSTKQKLFPSVCHVLCCMYDWLYPSNTRLNKTCSRWKIVFNLKILETTFTVNCLNLSRPLSSFLFSEDNKDSDRTQSCRHIKYGRCCKDATIFKKGEASHLLQPIEESQEVYLHP